MRMHRAPLGSDLLTLGPLPGSTIWIGLGELVFLEEVHHCVWGFKKPWPIPNSLSVSDLGFQMWTLSPLGFQLNHHLDRLPHFPIMMVMASYPSGTGSPNKIFLLEVALAIVFYHSDIKITNIFTIVSCPLCSFSHWPYTVSRAVFLNLRVLTPLEGQNDVLIVVA